MKKQFYFRREDSERCYTLDKHIEDAKEEGLTEIDLYIAVPQNVPDFIFCHAVDECGEKGECGRCCADYQPRNGKSGICKHQGKLYEPSEKVTIPVR